MQKHIDETDLEENIMFVKMNKDSSVSLSASANSEELLRLDSKKVILV